MEILAPTPLTFPDAQAFITGPLVLPLSAEGGFSVSLPATDVAGQNPTEWSYWVTEKLQGMPDRPTYAIKLPQALVNPWLDQIAPSNPATPTYVPVAGSQIYTGVDNPPANLGAHGDIYFQVSIAVAGGVESRTLSVWRNSGGEWTKNLDGIRGSAIYASVSESPGYGVDGDLHVQTNTGLVSQFRSGTWVALGNIKGPKGDQGEAGPIGPAGPKGDPGQNGTGAGTVTAVNGVQPDATGNLTLEHWQVGALSINGGRVASGNLQLDSDTPDYRSLAFTTARKNRWVYMVNAEAETGSDAGSNFELTAWSDIGEWKATAIHGQRTNGTIALGTSIHQSDAQLTVAGPVAVNNVATPPGSSAGTVKLYSESGVLKVVTPNSRYSVAPLDNSEKLPAVHVPDLSATYVPQSLRGAASGVAPLDEASALPMANLPTAIGRNTWTPQSLGFKAWTLDPNSVANPSPAKAATIQRLYLAAVNITEPTTVSTVLVHSRGWAGSTAVPAARFFAGIYNASGSRVAWSGATALSNVGAAGQIAGSPALMRDNHIGAAGFPLSATYTMAPGIYYLAFLMTAGTATDFYYFHVQNEAPSNAGNFFWGAARPRNFYYATQTTLPTAINIANGVTNHDPMIMALA
ncbi:hypothetical protein [Streptomyces tsukubensis]|uniref:hypothetical protein n=1 Tax=Streptomyces tsukubensis TaxID=83656 RepID=UPI003450CAF5